MPTDATAVVIFGDNWIMQLDSKPGILFWSSKMSVDADGHPQCYHPAGSPPGLDFLANAGKPGNWWGIACDSKGKPYIQTNEMEAPGFYVSTTALVDSAFKENHPAKYVNAGKVPYIVLPSSPKFSPKQKLGDLAMCFNTQNGKKSWAIYADVGPKNAIGEGSMHLSEMLGLSVSPKTGGTQKEIIATVFWPGSSIGWPKLHIELAATAEKLFMEWGGYDSLMAGMPQYDWSKFMV